MNIKEDLYLLVCILFMIAFAVADNVQHGAAVLLRTTIFPWPRRDSSLYLQAWEILGR